MVQDKNNDTKYDWPKFSCDTKTFKAWYLVIIAQLLLPQWKDLYDSNTKDIVKHTSNVALNGKLYVKLITCLEGSALQSIVARTHLHSDGLSILHDLSQTHRPLHILEIVAAKTVQFWGNTKRMAKESVDAYYNRFKELYDKIQDADGNIPTKLAVHHFIFTLGSEFEPIQNNFRLENLPIKWQTEDWPTLLVLCRNFYHSVKPHGVTSSVKPQGVTGQPKNNFAQHNVDCITHQKKVREWFSFPAQYCKEIATEQCKYPNKCIYHLSDTHCTNDCHIKKEREKTSMDQKLKTPSPLSSAGSANGCLHHITAEDFVDEESDELPSVEDSNGNDTNEDTLLYFHYLQLVKSSPSMITTARHQMVFPVIADSGANYHMFKDCEFFESLSPASGSVILGDGKTTLSIQGVGTIKCRIGDHIVRVPNVRCIPDLSESIYSLFVHIKTPNHGLESSFDNGLSLQFPEFTTKALIGQNDIYVDMQPLTTSSDDMSNLSVQSDTPFCRKLSDVAEIIDQEIKQSNNILRDLRDYYSQVKTKRQLGFEVPAGFRQAKF
jgi:hypothetical protein